MDKLDPSDRRAKGKLGSLLAAAQGESVKIALDASEKPVECDVIIDGKPQGTYKGRDPAHLLRIITLRMEEAGVKGTAEVNAKALPETETVVEQASLAPQQAAVAVPQEPEALTVDSVPEKSE